MALYKLRYPEPNAKQKLFLKSRKKYVGYGGARGGGKSWVVRIKAILLALRYKGIKILIVRRTYKDLKNNHIDPMRLMIPRGIARYNHTDKEFRFFNGSLITFTYCASIKDLPNFQGQEYDIIFLDEGTQHEEQVFKELAVCLRGVNGFPKRLYVTCNPGGIGHGWMHRIFVLRQFKDDEEPDEYEFIQAKATDNTILMKIQPDYMKQLDALPYKKRLAWRDGDWNIFEGQYFEEFTVRPDEKIAQELGVSVERLIKERRFTHVIEPFNPPLSWPRFRSFDWGSAKPFSVGWWAQDKYKGTLYRILELYGCSPNEENVGVKWEKNYLFERIREIEQQHPYLTHDGVPLSITGIADPSIWESDGGPSIADTAAAHGIYFFKGDNKRIPGWMQVHSRLAFDEQGRPLMYFFNTCKAAIRTVPKLIHDEHIPEDVDSKGEDHPPDEIRYMCMHDPVPPRGSTRQFVPLDDPLDLYAQIRPSEYEFYRY